MLASYTPTATSRGRIPSPQTSGSKLSSNISYVIPAQPLHELEKRGKTTGMGRSCGMVEEIMTMDLFLCTSKAEDLQMRLYFLSLFDGGNRWGGARELVA